MSDDPELPAKPADAAQARRDRLAAELRANLRRRKAQRRRRAATDRIDAADETADSEH